MLILRIFGYILVLHRHRLLLLHWARAARSMMVRNYSPLKSNHSWKVCCAPLWHMKESTSSVAIFITLSLSLSSAAISAGVSLDTLQNITGLKMAESHCCPEILLKTTSSDLGRIPPSFGEPWIVYVFPEFVTPYVNMRQFWPSMKAFTVGITVSSKKVFCSAFSSNICEKHWECWWRKHTQKAVHKQPNFTNLRQITVKICFANPNFKASFVLVPSRKWTCGFASQFHADCSWRCLSLSERVPQACVHFLSPYIPERECHSASKHNENVGHHRSLSWAVWIGEWSNVIRNRTHKTSENLRVYRRDIGGDCIVESQEHANSHCGLTLVHIITRGQFELTWSSSFSFSCSVKGRTLK